MKKYRIKKCLSIFRNGLILYRKKRKDLSTEDATQIASTLNQLQHEILECNREKAHEYANKVQLLCDTTLKKNLFKRICSFLAMISFALIAAIVIRAVWFELYEIPTGSMRPTFSEKDRLVVSKTAFGINIPLKTGHLYFDPDLILRNGIMIFTTENMDISDKSTRYFYIFPGNKQYIKRMMGKPGDTLYFYGGQIYGIDQNENDITPLLQPSNLKNIDHIPFIHFNGKVSHARHSDRGIYSPVTLKQMNKSIASIQLDSQNKLKGKLLPPYESLNDYYDVWGFNNYAVARLLTKNEVIQFTDTPIEQLPNAPLYMEIIHHPSVKYPKIEKDHLGRLVPSVGTSSSLLPLSDTHLKKLFSNLYTARFVVKNEKAFRYGSKLNEIQQCKYCVSLPGVPDGTYEFYYGKAYKIYISGIIKEVSKNHPLYQFDFQHIQTLYNLGIEFANYYAPRSKNQYLLPSRYVYFNQGNLYAMGAPLMDKNDPVLETFTQKEFLKEQNAPSYRPHIPFKDQGPPYKNGKIDVELIKKNGLTIPQNHYLALGDNYAMSADSREFGFVPEDNIRGAPTFIFWPPGSRFGIPLQASYPFFNFPRTIIWIIALITYVVWKLYKRKYYKLPVKIE